MDVIKHACSIGSGPVSAKHLQCWSVVNGQQAHKREKVVGTVAEVGGGGADGLEDQLMLWWILSSPCREGRFS